MDASHFTLYLIQVMYEDAELSVKKMEETVHGSYSWCRLTKREKNRNRSYLYLWYRKANVNPDTRVRDLTDDEVKRLQAVIDETMMVEGDLRREIALNIKRLQEIGCYRGIRHRKGLPVRGQKTKTNARTRKGPKRTVANKKK